MIEEEKFEIWKPKFGEKYYFVNKQGDVNADVSDCSYVDVKFFLTGKYYETKEEAEREAKRDKAIQRIKEWTTAENKGWKPKWGVVWNESEVKYTIKLLGSSELFAEYYTDFKINPDNFMYVKTMELAERMIRELEQELKLYWRID